MKIKIPVIAIVAIAGVQTVCAQIPEDALRMSWNVPSGTARSQAIGGAMGSLGGDISSMYVNPAGLGVYKTGEVVFSPGFNIIKGNSRFLGEKQNSDSYSKFNMGLSGVVWSAQDRYSRWSSKAFALGINRTANFNNTVYYRGTNDYSSFSEPLANEFFNFYVNSKDANPSRPDAEIVNDALNSPDVSLLTKMALYTYLVDIDSSGGQSTVFSRAEEAGIVNQESRIVTTGGITELAFGFAGNMDDQLYLGASIGVPIVNYNRTTFFDESDANGAGNNEFNYSSLREDFSSKGVGVNGKFGLIFKPAGGVRVGVAIHTPTIYGLKDRLSSEFETDIDTTSGNPKVFNVRSSDLFDGIDPEYQYDLLSPWHFIVSGSYVIHEAEDVKNQKGFVSADVEYVTYGSPRFSPGQDGVDKREYEPVNSAVSEIYKGAFNFRAGGEMKFNTFMARLGFAYYGNPYDDDMLKAKKMNISGGIGYRNKGMFVDLTYVQGLNKDVSFPYRVEAPRQNVFSSLNDNSANVLLTLGFKF